MTMKRKVIKSASTGKFASKDEMEDSPDTVYVQTVGVGKKRILKELIDLEATSDCESAHAEADKLIIEYLESIGEKEIAEAYNKIEKWYA